MCSSDLRRSDGYVKQLVHESDRAYHARCWNVQAIGVELEGFLKDPEAFSSSMMEAAARLVADIASRHGISVDDLHIIGHDFGDTDKIRRTPLQRCNDHADPGRYFPWDGFLGMVGGGGRSSPIPSPSQPASRCSWWNPWCR